MLAPVRDLSTCVQVLLFHATLNALYFGAFVLIVAGLLLYNMAHTDLRSVARWLHQHCAAVCPAACCHCACCPRGFTELREDADADADQPASAGSSAASAGPGSEESKSREDGSGFAPDGWQVQTAEASVR